MADDDELERLKKERDHWKQQADQNKFWYEKALKKGDADSRYYYNLWQDAKQKADNAQRKIDRIYKGRNGHGDI